MGYFLDLAKNYIEYDFDRSYPSPEEQLFWRLDDLKYKLEELTEKDAPYRGWERLTDNDIRYAIPEYFETIADVERAIELALEDLKNKYDVEISELDSEQEEVFDDGAVQMTLFEIIPFPAQPTPLKAA